MSLKDLYSKEVVRILLTFFFTLIGVWYLKPSDLGLSGEFFLLLCFLFLVVFLGGAARIYKKFIKPIESLPRRIDKMRKGQWDIPLEELSESDFEGWLSLDESLYRFQKKFNKTRKKFWSFRNRLNSTLSSLKNPICAFDLDKRLIFSNESFMDLFKVSDEKKIVFLSDIFRDDEMMTQVKGVNESLRSKVFEFQSSELGDRYFDVTVSPIVDRELNKSFGVVLSFHETTNFKKSQKLRIDFVANVSHELRTPLTSVNGFLEAGIKGLKNGGSDSIAHLEKAEANLKRLNALTEELLLLSSIESGQKLKKEKVQVSSITDIALERVFNKYSDSKVKVSVSDQAHEVFADATFLEQVLVNLLDNAYKYIGDGNKVEVRWSPVPKGVQLEVIDDGIGMSESQSERIFERFYRADASRNQKIQGTGLGLAIVKHIVLRHGGTIEVSTSPGSGSKFTCIFPSYQN